MGYNKGDTIELYLDYTINEEPLVDYEPDEIEFYIGDNRYLLSDGTIELDEETEKYKIFLDQNVTFSLDNITEFQIRIRKGIEVVSDTIQRMPIGKSISRIVI